jgi:hypothetical protein
MNNTDQPARTPTPFATGGTKNAIPNTTGTPGAASYAVGFPTPTFTPIPSGGVPPSGADLNGIFFALSQAARWSQAGGQYQYDGVFSSAVSGYPQGAIIQAADYTGLWRNLVNGNTTNPDTGGSGWAPSFLHGVATQNLTNVNVTLTSLQAAKNVLLLGGTLTGNVQVIFPILPGVWTVVNATTGAFTVTAKTIAGAGVILQPGANPIYGDGGGTIDFAVRDLPVVTQFSPVVSFGGASAGVTYAVQEGFAFRQGRGYRYHAFINMTNKGSSTGPAKITLTGLPAPNAQYAALVSIDQMTGLAFPLSGLTAGGTNLVELRTFDGSGSQAALATDANFTNTSQVYVEGWFLV